jgi:putative ABC transport system permease protein
MIIQRLACPCLRWREEGKKLIYKHILKNIWENKRRSILIITALTLSAMVMYLNLTFKDDMNIRYSSMLKGATQEYDFQINRDVHTDDVYFDDASLSYEGIPVNYILPSIHTFGLMNTGSDSQTVQLMGSDRDLLIKTGLCVVDTAFVSDASGSTQIITNEAAATAYDLSAGDTVTLTTSWGEETFVVAAIAENKGIFQNTKDSVLFILPKAYLEEKMGLPGMSDSVWVDMQADTKIKSAIEKFETANPEFRAAALLDEDAIRDSVSMFNQLITVILLMVAILTFYVVSSITRLLLAIRIPVVGTFRSVGATKRRVNGILFLENGVYGLIGGVFGIILGMLARDTVISAFLNMSSQQTGTNTIAFNPLYIFGVLGFSVLLQLFITASTIFKVAKMPIKDTIFNVQNVKQRVSNRKTIIGVILLIASFVIMQLNVKYSLPIAGIAFIAAISGAVFMIPYLTSLLTKGLSAISRRFFGNAAELGVKNISYSKSITSSVVLTTVALSVLLAVYMLTLSVNTIFDKAVNIFASDIQVSNPSKSYEEYENLTDLEGVDSVDFLFTYFCTVEWGDKSGNLGVVGLDRAREGIRETGDKIEDLKDGELLIDEYYAVRNDIAIGDKMYIPEKDLTFTVVGHMDASQFSISRSIVCVKESYFTQNIVDVPMFVNVFTSSDIEKTKMVLKEAFAGENVQIQTAEEYFAIQEKSVGSIVSLTVLITVVSVLLALVGLVNNQMIGFIQRKREYVILYSVSMSRSQLRIMMLFEVMGTFVIGILLGTILSFWLNTLLEHLMFSIGMYMTMEFDYLPILGVAGAIFLFLMLTAIPPMRRLTRINIVNEIKYE